MRPDNYLEYYKGKSGLLDKIAFVSNSVLLVIFLYDTIFSDVKMFFLLIPIILIEVYLFIYCIIHDDYYFFNEQLMIYHFCKKRIIINYADIFNMDAEIRDNFVNINKSNEIKIYFLKNNHKKCVLCRTADSLKFVSSIKRYCPIFKETIRKDTELNKLLK